MGEVKTQNLNTTSKVDDLLNNRNSSNSDNLGELISLNRVRERIEDFQQTVLIDVQKRMDGMVEDVIQEITRYEIHTSEFKGLIEKQAKDIYSNRRKDENATKTRKLPDKIFITRNSFLTDLFGVSHIKSIYHMFFAMLVVMFLNTIIHDYIVEGRINIGFNPIQGSFQGFGFAFGIWILLQFTVCGVYYGFRIWSEIRFMLRKNRPLEKVWNWISLIAFVGYQLLIGYSITHVLLVNDVRFILTLSLLLEMTRMLMKNHAFVRTNVPRQLMGKLKSEDGNDERTSIPAFSKFIYFLFAPTLIYRDEYPRTKQIRWTFVAKRVAEIIAIMFFISYIYERYILPYFEDFGKAPLQPGHLVVSIFGMMMPSLLIFLCVFYCILHCVQNIGGEMLRFGDRMFYKDWWTSGNYDAYYRDWNIVVHDWLYEYIYKDMYTYVFCGSKVASSLAVFMVSAIVHEYILMIGLGFLYPVMFVSFGVIGVSLVFLTRLLSKEAGNLVLWLSIGTGNGIIISLYAMEYYARINCPIDMTQVSYVTPVSWLCFNQS